VGLLWASPSCTHFSRARGGVPVSKQLRSLGWVVVRWAAAARPRVIICENVSEWQDWGPVLVNKGIPCPRRKGKTFQQFVGHIERLGYRVEIRELRGCDYGAGTIRKRLFLIATRDRMPIHWPQPTHNEHGTDGLQPWRTAAECIDWSLSCPSIFERKKPLADATLRRIARGIVRYVLEAQEPFIVTNTSGHPGAPVSDPLRTVTTAGNQMLVTPTLIQAGYGERAGQQPRTLDIGKPLGTIAAAGDDGALVAALLIKYYGNDREGVSLTDPLHTIPTKDRFGLVTVTKPNLSLVARASA
jgi:DNA (cytosine-5)-methyltransferase 1